MKKLLIALGVMGVMFLGCAGFFVYRIATTDFSQLEQSMPGGSEFHAADQQITSFKGEEAFGNTEEARELAAAFAEITQVATEASFSGGKKGGLSTTKGHFLTYCQLNEDSVCFLVHVPQFKRYKKDVRDSLIELCWASAKLIVEKAVDGDIELAIGLRGSITYGGSAIGMSSSDTPKTENSFMVSSMEFHKYFLPVADADTGEDDSDEVDAEETTDTEEPNNTAEDASTDDQNPAPEDSPSEETAPAGKEEPVGK